MCQGGNGQGWLRGKPSEICSNFAPPDKLSALRGLSPRLRIEEDNTELLEKLDELKTSVDELKK